jgi:hypothetical protein
MMVMERSIKSIDKNILLLKENDYLNLKSLYLYI